MKQKTRGALLVFLGALSFVLALLGLVVSVFFEKGGVLTDLLIIWFAWLGAFLFLYGRDVLKRAPHDKEVFRDIPGEER